MSNIRQRSKKNKEHQLIVNGENSDPGSPSSYRFVGTEETGGGSGDGYRQPESSDLTAATTSSGEGTGGYRSNGFRATGGKKRKHSPKNEKDATDPGGSDVFFLSDMVAAVSSIRDISSDDLDSQYECDSSNSKKSSEDSKSSHSSSTHPCYDHQDRIVDLDDDESNRNYETSGIIINSRRDRIITNRRIVRSSRTTDPLANEELIMRSSRRQNAIPYPDYNAARFGWTLVWIVCVSECLEKVSSSYSFICHRYLFLFSIYTIWYMSGRYRKYTSEMKIRSEIVQEDCRRSSNNNNHWEESSSKGDSKKILIAFGGGIQDSTSSNTTERELNSWGYYLGVIGFLRDYFDLSKVRVSGVGVGSVPAVFLALELDTLSIYKSLLILEESRRRNDGNSRNHDAIGETTHNTTDRNTTDRSTIYRSTTYRGDKKRRKNDRSSSRTKKKYSSSIIQSSSNVKSAAGYYIESSSNDDLLRHDDLSSFYPSKNSILRRQTAWFKNLMYSFIKGAYQSNQFPLKWTAGLIPGFSLRFISPTNGNYSSNHIASISRPSSSTSAQYDWHLTNRMNRFNDMDVARRFQNSNCTLATSDYFLNHLYIRNLKRIEDVGHAIFCSTTYFPTYWIAGGEAEFKNQCRKDDILKHQIGLHHYSLFDRIEKGLSHFFQSIGTLCVSGVLGGSYCILPNHVDFARMKEMKRRVKMHASTSRKMQNLPIITKNVIRVISSYGGDKVVSRDRGAVDSRDRLTDTDFLHTNTTATIYPIALLNDDPITTLLNDNMNDNLKDNIMNDMTNSTDRDDSSSAGGSGDELISSESRKSWMKSLQKYYNSIGNTIINWSSTTRFITSWKSSTTTTKLSSTTISDGFKLGYKSAYESRFRIMEMGLELLDLNLDNEVVDSVSLSQLRKNEDPILLDELSINFDKPAPNAIILNNGNCYQRVRYRYEKLSQKQLVGKSNNDDYSKIKSRSSQSRSASSESPLRKEDRKEESPYRTKDTRKRRGSRVSPEKESRETTEKESRLSRAPRAFGSQKSNSDDKFGLIDCRSDQRPSPAPSRSSRTRGETALTKVLKNSPPSPSRTLAGTPSPPKETHLKATSSCDASLCVEVTAGGSISSTSDSSSTVVVSSSTPAVWDGNLNASPTDDGNSTTGAPLIASTPRRDYSMRVKPCRTIAIDLSSLTSENEKSVSRSHEDNKRSVSQSHEDKKKTVTPDAVDQSDRVDHAVPNHKSDEENTDPHYKPPKLEYEIRYDFVGGIRQKTKIDSKREHSLYARTQRDVRRQKLKKKLRERMTGISMVEEKNSNTILDDTKKSKRLSDSSFEPFDSEIQPLGVMGFNLINGAVNSEELNTKIALHFADHHMRLTKWLNLFKRENASALYHEATQLPPTNEETKWLRDSY